MPNESVGQIEKKKPRPLYDVLPDGRWDFYIDHSTLKDFMTCEQYFKYRHVDLIKARGTGGFAMNVGSWWSLALEKIYLHIQEFGHISLAECQMMGAAAWKELSMSEVEKGDPKNFQSWGSHFGAIVMMDGFYESHIKNDIKKYKIISAESGFGLKGEVLVGSNKSVVVHWVGKPDLTVLDGRRLSPFDHKSVTRIDGDIHGKYKPHPQIAGYCYATRVLANQTGLDVTVDRVIINVCARQTPSQKPRDGRIKPRFIRVTVAFTDDEIEEWRVNTINKVTRLREAIEHNTYTWNENQCSYMFFKPCPYRGIDSNPPASRPIIIKSNYDIVDRWVPYQVEDEGDDD